MPIISKVGRRSIKGRLLAVCIVLALLLGSLTMVYPFLLMIAGSTKSAVDQRDVVLIPEYLRDDEALYRKHIEGLFNESPASMNIAYDCDDPSFERLHTPTHPNKKFAEAWEVFVAERELPGYFSALGYTETLASKTLPWMLREFKKCIAVKYGDDISVLNRLLGVEYSSWFAFMVAPDNYVNRSLMPADNELRREFWAFKQTRPAGLKYYMSIEGAYKKEFLKSLYTGSIEQYNQTHGTQYNSYTDVHLSRSAPEGGQDRRDWEKYVRYTLNPLWIMLDGDALPLYLDYLRVRFNSRIDALNNDYSTQYSYFSDITFASINTLNANMRRDLVAFITGWKDESSGVVYKAPLDSLRVRSIDFMFRDWLEDRYDNIDKVNLVLGTSFSSFMDILPPQKDAHYFYFMEHVNDFRKEFTGRNFLAVIDYMVFHGRGIVNTVIYCVLTVLFALIVNPLAAYALSRYRLPSAYKILLILMLTMAFPPIITQIPMFLMLRDLRMLNTFAALILPGIANGYSIFLLKGFFDSLPRELYECAELDGANEWIMFWNITIKLSTPVLAVIALQAFTLAYGNFMFALLICQDQKMWTLMVWLYQLRQFSGEGVVYASLLIAAVPTFVIFVFCQKIIMRGIVVPSEK